jgi:hypothetical protein
VQTGFTGLIVTVTVSPQPVVRFRNARGTSTGPGCVPGCPSYRRRSGT